MEELKNKYNEKAKEMKEKYADIINDISVAQGVDVGVAFDMLKAIAVGGDYAGDIEIDVEELKKDYFELAKISEEIVKEMGV